MMFKRFITMCKNFNFLVNIGKINLDHILKVCILLYIAYKCNIVRTTLCANRIILANFAAVFFRFSLWLPAMDFCFTQVVLLTPICLENRKPEINTGSMRSLAWEMYNFELKMHNCIQ